MASGRACRHAHTPPTQGHCTTQGRAAHPATSLPPALLPHGLTSAQVWAGQTGAMQSRLGLLFNCILAAIRRLAGAHPGCDGWEAAVRVVHRGQRVLLCARCNQEWRRGGAGSAGGQGSGQHGAAPAENTQCQARPCVGQECDRCQQGAALAVLQCCRLLQAGHGRQQQFSFSTLATVEARHPATTLAHTWPY